MKEVLLLKKKKTEGNIASIVISIFFSLTLGPQLPHKGKASWPCLGPIRLIVRLLDSAPTVFKNKYPG